MLTKLSNLLIKNHVLVLLVLSVALGVIYSAAEPVENEK